MAKEKKKQEPIKYTCKGKAVRHEGELVGRTECGRDLSPLVEAVPWDGRDRQVSCPDCGNVGTVKRIPE